MWLLAKVEDNEGNIVSCRARGFEALEATPNYLTSGAIVDSYDEIWSFRKVLSRFIWHDKIHAKAIHISRVLFLCII